MLTNHLFLPFVVIQVNSGASRESSIEFTDTVHILWNEEMNGAHVKLLEWFPSIFCRHEDGTVRFWDASGVCLYPLYKLSTSVVFQTDADPNDNMNQGTEGEWPPFRKVGLLFVTLFFAF